MKEIIEENVMSWRNIMNFGLKEPKQDEWKKSYIHLDTSGKISELKDKKKIPNYCQREGIKNGK